jgi:hypothetical protein
LSFGYSWDLLIFSSFLFVLFGMGMSTLYLFHYCIWQALTLSDFTGSLWKAFISRLVIP